MKTRTMGLIALLAMMLIGCAGTMTALAGKADPTLSLLNMKMSMRKLWEEHIMYTRNYIISSLAGLEDVDKVEERLLRNPDDIGWAIKPYYGDAAGDTLASLLRNHMYWTAQVVTASKAGDQTRLTRAQSSWVANRHAMAIFLSRTNPNLSQENLETMLQNHLNLTTAEVVARLNKDWRADIRAYDEGHANILMFADALTTGIAKQFPGKFK